MAMSRLQRRFGDLPSTTYKRSDTLNEFLNTPLDFQDPVVAKENSIEAKIQEAVRSTMATDPNKAELAESPWVGPLDPTGEH